MRNKRELLLGIALTALSCGLVIWFLIPAYHGNLNDYPACTRVCDRKGRELRIALGKNNALCEPIRLGDTGDWAVKALIAAEDKRFFRHNGVDFLAIARASILNVVSRKVVSGASTVSTLVVKLTEPRRRNLWTKIVEAHHAINLERWIGKDAILEQYFNRAPFGGNVQGIESASRHYFDKSAKDLSLSEAALLVGLPQSPSRLRPDRALDRALERRNYVLSRMKACGFITDQQYETTRAQQISATCRSLPFLAPHFCDLVLKHYPGHGSLTTTLDLDLQTIATSVLESKLKGLADQNVTGGAVVIIDVKASALRAMVGSPYFWDRANAGQVNGATAPRSPGSALKPFVYASALDQGICSPQTVAADAPVNFAGYKPRNFDLDYHGPVPIRSALVNSLNIPALLYTQRIGLENFVQCLRRLGISTLDKPPSHYGLSIAIGTCEVTLLDLANTYACLAREGTLQPLRLLEKTRMVEGERVFSRETAYMIADILSGDERLLDVIGHNGDVLLPRIAWKTGTSAGNRDAWAIAYNPDHVVAVWLGNPSGQCSRDLTGNSAAIAACEIFRRIYPNGTSPWFERPSGLETREVCAASGKLPTDHCPATITDFYIRGITANEKCDIHGNDQHAGNAASVAKAQEADSTPAHSIRITSPNNHETFRILYDAPQLRQEIKLCALSTGESPIHWFVDSELYKKAAPDEPQFWRLSKGKHRISCCDMAGNSDSIELTVE